ncbi:MAG: hypothetical protein ACRD8Z_27250 [Nitrososphaeraceae archaeon]
MRFVGDDGSIIVPKSVRPIIEYSPTALGSGCGALRQFRAGKLHIREYDSYYSVHSDKIDPLNDPLGHLIIDAPEYLVGILSGLSIYSTLKDKSTNRSRKDRVNLNSNSFSEIGAKNGSSPFLTGIVAAYTAYALTNSLKKLCQRRE